MVMELKQSCNATKFRDKGKNEKKERKKRHEVELEHGAAPH